MVDIEISGQKYLSGLTISEREKIEQELTFKNPKYEQIMRYSKWNSTREPQYIEYFNYFNHNGNLVMQVPLGYTCICYPLQSYHKAFLLMKLQNL